MSLLPIVFLVLYILCWAGGWYFNAVPPAPNRPYNFGWALPLICIGILGWYVFRPH
jgi:hypothetical protein